MDQDDEDRATIARGYVAMLLLLLMMAVTDLIEHGIAGDLTPLATDPGIDGLWLLVILACINVAAQIVAPLINAPASRWALFAMTVAYTLFFVGHQASHLLAGDGFDMHFLLDLAHHGAGLAATLAAWRLARTPAVLRVPA